MGQPTIIGRATRVRGRLAGSADLEIHGLVDGEVQVDGDVTVSEGGLVAASISGARVTVRGAVRGDVTGTDAVHLEDGARVVGDLRAPRISIGAGALLRGHVHAGTGADERTAKTQPARTPARAPVNQAQLPAVRPAADAAVARGLPSTARPALPKAAERIAPTKAVEKPAPSQPRMESARLVPPVREAHSTRDNGAGRGVQPAEAAGRKGPPPPVVPALKKGAKATLQKKRG
jgi:cytoskeletal protein CcmA (bactofilin family)